MIELLQVNTEHGLLQAEEDVLRLIRDYALLAMRDYERTNLEEHLKVARAFYKSLKHTLDNYEFRILEQKRTSQ